MNVYLDYLLIVNYDHAVAYGLKVSAELGYVGTVIILFKHELCTVCECDIVVILADSCSERVALVLLKSGSFIGLGNSAACENVCHSAEDYAQTLAACVNDSCFFQLREHFGGLGENSLSLGAYLLPECDLVVGLCGYLPCLLSSCLDYGEDSSLNGLHNSLVCCLYAELQSVREVLAACLRAARESLRKASENK